MDRFLRSVSGIDVFQAYCRDRHIPFPHPAALGEENARRWTDALAALPEERRGRVERELSAVSELSGRDGAAHLLDVAEAADVPPDGVPDRGPLALWFLLHRPGLFWEVFFYRQMKKLIDDGHIYVARPPLFKVTHKKQVRYVQRVEEMNGELLQRGLLGTKLQVLRQDPLAPSASEGTPAPLPIEGERLTRLLQVLVQGQTRSCLSAAGRE